MDNAAHNTPVRLSGFAAACLWHHRLSRTTMPRPALAPAFMPDGVRVRPSLRAEFVSRPAWDKQNPRVRGMLPPDGGIRPEAAGSRHAA
jgi:hypothetical protein